LVDISPPGWGRELEFLSSPVGPFEPFGPATAVDGLSFPARAGTITGFLRRCPGVVDKNDDCSKLAFADPVIAGKSDDRSWAPATGEWT
jgi:hypothetical protein